MSDFEQAEWHQRAVQLGRWLETMTNKLTIRVRRTVLRDLRRIIKQRPWEPFNPQLSPLFGLDPRGFVEELHRPDGGRVARISMVGPETIDELRRVLPPPGSPQIPSFPPPAPSPLVGAMASEDGVLALLVELWPRLEPIEQNLVLQAASSLFFERLRRRAKEPDLLSDRTFAKKLERQLREAQLSAGKDADDALA